MQQAYTHARRGTSLPRRPTLPSLNGAPGRVWTYAEPALCILRLDELAGAADRTAIGATNAAEDAMREAALPRKIWVATMIALKRVVARRGARNREVKWEWRGCGYECGGMCGEPVYLG